MTISLAAGCERLVSWADVLDRINVFPVPDGDTGRNMVLSLAPLRRTGETASSLREALLLSARGNSGNIAARFLRELIGPDAAADLVGSCKRGRDQAYQAVSDPKPGTMLSLFDELVAALDENPPGSTDWDEVVLNRLQYAVMATRDQLPELKEAGVVDAGALGMFIFFDACFRSPLGRQSDTSQVADFFRGALELDEAWTRDADDGFCLDVVLQVGQGAASALDRVSRVGHSVVAMAEGEYLKVHLHTSDAEATRDSLAGLGSVVRYAADNLNEQTARFTRVKTQPALRIMTDAAGSMTKETAEELGVLLLDSYVNVETTSLPETYVDSAGVYKAMRSGARASTSQASDEERRQCYSKAVGLYDRVLYIAVGSYFTGNYQAALDWKKQNDHEDRLTIMDSGSASGRLGLAAIAAARRSLEADDPDDIQAYAEWAVENTREYIFLDKLQYLAAGGRMSKTSAFFGELFRVKPVVSPKPTGAKRWAWSAHWLKGWNSPSASWNMNSPLTVRR